MRTKTVTVGGKRVTVRERKVRELREEVLPRLTGFFGEDLQEAETVEALIPVMERKLAEFFPELTEADLDEAYPSEIEELIQAFIDVNFGGLKKILPPMLSLARTGTWKPA